MADNSVTLDEELAVLWTLVCAFFLLFMQCGFALLESGAVRSKNVKNILLKNVIDTAISIMCWYAVGYAFAYGSCGGNPFIGTRFFFSSNNSNTTGSYWAHWVFRWAFSATASTIVSGAVAERTQLKAYAIHTALISAFIYPLVVHWVWSRSGWLSAYRQDCGSSTAMPYFSKTNGLMDYAGSGVVHMVGGGAALMGALVLGPRLGRFLPEPVGGVARWDPASPTNMVLGSIILWIGWYGFNAGSTGCFQGCMGVAAKISINTTLSVGCGVLTSLALAVLLGDPGDIAPTLNGILAGGVSITAGCALVEEYAAVVIGLVGALVYVASSKLLLRLHVDDPLDASPVHFFCGVWGLLAPGFFATQSSTIAAYGYANDWGVFYGGKGNQLGLQVLGVVVISSWTCALSGGAFLLLKLCGWLRVSRDMEIAGLDYTQGLERSKLRSYAKARQHQQLAPPAACRDAELAQHGARSADMVLHGRRQVAGAPAPGSNGWHFGGLELGLMEGGGSGSASGSPPLGGKLDSIPEDEAGAAGGKVHGPQYL